MSPWKTRIGVRQREAPLFLHTMNLEPQMLLIQEQRADRSQALQEFLEA